MPENINTVDFKTRKKTIKENASSPISVLRSTSPKRQGHKNVMH